MLISPRWRSAVTCSQVSSMPWQSTRQQNASQLVIACLYCTCPSCCDAHTIHHKLQAMLNRCTATFTWTPTALALALALTLALALASASALALALNASAAPHCQPAACSISLHLARVTSLAGGEWPPGHGPSSHPQGVHWECPASRSACCVCFHAALLQNPHSKAYHCCLVMLADAHFALLVQC